MKSLSTASEWIAHLADGELTRSQKASLTEWLRDSPRNVREFVELTFLSADIGALALTREQVDEWAREARETTAIAIPGSVPLFQPPPAPRGLRRWAIAASIVVMVFVLGAYLQWQNGRYITHFGEQRILTLADGSVVTLNTASELRVRFSDDKRALELVRGEAFFRAAHDTARPFVVTAENASVKAVGTQFNVRIAARTTVVSVLDGAVEVRDHESSKPAMKLAKGDEASFDRHRDIAPTRSPAIVKSSGTAALRAAAWTNGRVEFEATPLSDVLSEFQRYREFSVHIEPPLRALKLTGSFDAQDPESALAYIATLPGIVVERPSGQTFLIRQK